MGNHWIEYVKHFAKHHQISYTEALKHAGPSYRNLKIGGGLEDLTPELQGEVSSFLDDKDLGNLASMSKSTRNVRDIELDDTKWMRDTVKELHTFLNGPYKSFKDRETARKRSRKYPPNPNVFNDTIHDYYEYLRDHLERYYSRDYSKYKVHSQNYITDKLADDIEDAMDWLKKIHKKPV